MGYSILAFCSWYEHYQPPRTLLEVISCRWTPGVPNDVTGLFTLPGFTIDGIPTTNKFYIHLSLSGIWHSWRDNHLIWGTAYVQRLHATKWKLINRIKRGRIDLQSLRPGKRLIFRTVVMWWKAISLQRYTFSSIWWPNSKDNEVKDNFIEKCVGYLLLIHVK